MYFVSHTKTLVGNTKTRQRKERNAMSKIVCLCKQVSEETIVEAIKNGADTLDKVKEATGAATGACKGARCSQTIEALIQANA